MGSPSPTPRCSKSGRSFRRRPRTEITANWAGYERRMPKLYFHSDSKTVKEGHRLFSLLLNPGEGFEVAAPLSKQWAIQNSWCMRTAILQRQKLNSFIFIDIPKRASESITNCSKGVVVQSHVNLEKFRVWHYRILLPFENRK